MCVCFSLGGGGEGKRDGCKRMRANMCTCTDEEICVYGMFAGEKYMALLPELHINRHAIERHSLYLFFLQNINVRQEVTENSQDTP